MLFLRKKKKIVVIGGNHNGWEEGEGIEREEGEKRKN